MSAAINTDMGFMSIASLKKIMDAIVSLISQVSITHFKETRYA